MRSYTAGRNQYSRWTKNTATAHLLDGDNDANNAYKKICAMKDWPFLERIRTVTTTAQTQFTSLPYDCDLVRSIYVIISGDTERHTPRLIASREQWDLLNQSVVYSNTPEFYHVSNGQVGLYPIPVSTGNTIYINQKTRPIDLSVADITSVTIATATNGSTAITASGSLTTLMAGMWLRITYTGGATGTGDGVWYEIASVTNSTTLVLVRKYGGVSISAGTAACTIAQMPLLPEAFHDTPWKSATAIYWAQELDPRKDDFKQEYADDIAAIIRGYSSSTTNMVLDDGEDDAIINPNLTISL